MGEKEVRSMLGKISGAIGPTVFVLIAGSNGLRDSGEPSLVVDCFRQILEYAKRFGEIHIVIVSIIPSVRVDAKMRFAETSGMLKKLTKLYQNSSFLNMNKTQKQNE